MSQEPIMILARIHDLASVARRLREVAHDVTLDGPDDDWRSAVVMFDGGKSRLTFNHDPDYLAEPNWSTQMSGMRDYYASRLPESDRKEKVLLLTTTFRFALGTEFEPDFEPEGDPRLDVLFAVAERLDGVLFTPTTLRDAGGRILVAFDSDLDDPEAVWPGVMGEVSVAEPLGAALHEASRPKPPDGQAEPEASPPTAERVARRALALTAVTARAILEQEAGRRSADQTHESLLRWVQEVGINNELEPDESEVLARRPGRLDRGQQIDSTWRLEGLAVLAWALNRFDLPEYDQLVVPKSLWQRLGVLPKSLWLRLGTLDAKAAHDLLANPALRSRAEIGTLRNRLFAIHWRLRNYRIRPEVIDFAEFARTCWFGPLDLDGVRLAKGDLALQGKRIDKALPEVFTTSLSIATERHLAANWLWEGPDQYSEASVAT